MKALDQADLPTQANLFRLMGVGLVEKVDPAAINGVQFQPVAGAARLRWATCAQTAASPEAALNQVIERARVGGEALTAGVSIEGAQPDGAQNCEVQTSAELKWLTNTPDDITVEVNSAQNGWLVLGDSWYPGWEARLEGYQVPLLPADYNFKAVAVASGTHRVEFVYRPASFYMGCGVSLLAIVVVLLISLRKPSG